MITLSDFQRIMPATPQERLELFLEPLLAAMEEFDINTPQRQAAFLAQIAHESGGLKYVRELASGDAYEGRKDLGNTHPGDGPKFRGHGLIQITGRANHQECGDALGLDLIEHPELLEEPTNACRSAAWFWKKKGLNELADADNFRVITIRINGGVNGMADRLKYWARAQEVLA